MRAWEYKAWGDTAAEARWRSKVLQCCAWQVAERWGTSQCAAGGSGRVTAAYPWNSVCKVAGCRRPGHHALA